MELLGGPLLGLISDVKGPRWGMLLSFASMLASCCALAAATSPLMLMMSQLPKIFSHGMMAAQTVASSTSEPGHRAKCLGRLTVSYGLGMVVGAPLGGKLALVYGFSAAAGISAVLALAGMLVTVSLLPHTEPQPHSKKTGAVDNAAWPSRACCL